MPPPDRTVDAIACVILGILLAHAVTLAYRVLLLAPACEDRCGEDKVEMFDNTCLCFESDYGRTAYRRPH